MKNRLTKKLRHLIYVEAEKIYRDQVSTCDQWGICCSIARAVKHLYKTTTLFDKFDYEDITPYDHIDLYTEVFASKPPMALISGYWFDLDETGVRLEIFKTAIEKTK